MERDRASPMMRQKAPFFGPFCVLARFRGMGRRELQRKNADLERISQQCVAGASRRESREIVILLGFHTRLQSPRRDHIAHSTLDCGVSASSSVAAGVFISLSDADGARRCRSRLVGGGASGDSGGGSMAARALRPRRRRRRQGRSRWRRWEIGLRRTQLSDAMPRIVPMRALAPSAAIIFVGVNSIGARGPIPG